MVLYTPLALTYYNSILCLQSAPACFLTQHKPATVYSGDVMLPVRYETNV
jgi:hypothetical protein